jgi:enterochelin esterase family protein
VEHFPTDAYLEYSFVKDGGERLLDPLNPRSIGNGVGSINNLFYMPGGGPAGDTRRRPNTPRGRLTREYLETEGILPGKRRQVIFYQPPADGPAPLAVVFDGPDYATRARLPVILDNLIADRRIQPVAVAMIQHAGPLRPLEYACNDLLLLFVLGQLLPLARSRLDLIDPASAPGAYGVAGASMGGLMALYCGLRVPEVFGHVLSQSGAFTLMGGMDALVYPLVSAGAGKQLKIWMDIGRFDFLLDTNRRMRDLMLDQGYDLAYHEYEGGHNYTCWGNDLHRGLKALWGENKG